MFKKCAEDKKTGSRASFSILFSLTSESVLAFSDSEHFRATRRAYPLSCRLAVLHGYSFGILHFPLGSAFHTVRLHLVTSLFVWRIDYPLAECQQSSSIALFGFWCNYNSSSSTSEDGVLAVRRFCNFVWWFRM